MKQIVTTLMLIAAISLIAVDGQAENRDQRRQARQSMRRPDAPQQNTDSMITLRVARMAKQYDLTAKQQTEVKELLKTRFVERHPKNNQRQDFRHFTQEQRDSLRTVFEKEQKEFNESMRKILGDEKYIKYLEDREKQQANRQRQQGQRQHRDPGNPERAPRD